MGCHALLHRIFLIHGSNPCLLHPWIGRWIIYHWCHLGSSIYIHTNVFMSPLSTSFFQQNERFPQHWIPNEFCSPHEEIWVGSCSDMYRHQNTQVVFWQDNHCLIHMEEKTYRLLLSSVQSLSRVQLFETLWTTACQASPSITNSQSLPKLMSIESLMPSNHLILCHPLLLLPSIFPSIRVFSNESAFLIRWPKYWSFSFNISPSNDHPVLSTTTQDLL